MDKERDLGWARLKDTVREAASVFDKRSLAGSDAAQDNAAELRSIWLGPFIPTPAENVELLRIIAGGCGATALAMAAALTDEEPYTLRESCVNYYSAAVLLGLAERAYQLAIQWIKDRSATETLDPARLPGTQFTIARMRAALATMTALLTRYATTRIELAADSYVPRYFIAAESESVVSAAYDVIGAVAGRETEAAVRIGQIWRDLKTVAVAAPATADLARELIGKSALGIDPNETPRWL